MASSKVLAVLRDNNKYPFYSSWGAYELPAEGVSYVIDIAATTEKTLVVPANFNLARLKYATDVWVKRGSVAISPATADWVQNDLELSPEIFPVVAGETLRFYSKAGGELNIIFYKSALNKYTNLILSNLHKPI